MSDLSTIHNDLGEVKGQLRMLIALVERHSEDDRRIHDAQEKRIAALEADNNQAKGKQSVVATVFGAIGGGAVTLVIKYLLGQPPT